MSRANLVSLLVTLLILPVNVAIVFLIVAIDNFFLIDMTYAAIFGVSLPILLLAGFWAYAGRKAEGRNRWILPGLASLAIIAGGALHFFILVIASASV